MLGLRAPQVMGALVLVLYLSLLKVKVGWTVVRNPGFLLGCLLECLVPR